MFVESTVVILVVIEGTLVVGVDKMVGVAVAGVVMSVVGFVVM